MPGVAFCFDIPAACLFLRGAELAYNAGGTQVSRHEPLKGASWQTRSISALSSKGCWKDHDAYQKAFERLLRDLKAESAEASE
jgi:hypothetical protein